MDSADEEEPARIVDAAVRRFLVTIDALDDLREHAAGDARALDTADAVKDLVMPRHKLPDQHHERYRDIVLEFLKAVEAQVEGAQGEWVAIDVTRYLDRLLAEFGREPWVWKIISAANRRAGRRSRAELLSQSLLIQLVSTFELLLGDIARSAHLSARFSQKAFGEASPTVTMESLVKAGSIEEVRLDLIEVRVDRLMRDSVQEWIIWFERTFGLRVDAHLPDSEVFNEILLRRNIAVHNDCRASAEYLRRRGSADTGVVRGQRLEVSPSYLEAAANHLTVVGLRLASLARDKVGMDSKLALDYLTDSVYEFLKAGRWWRVVQLAESEEAWSSDQQTRLIARVNGLLGRKRLEGLDSISEQVNAIETNVLSWNFRIAKLALLDEMTELRATIAKALDAGEFQPLQLMDWPILSEFRDSEEFAELLRARDDLGDLSRLIEFPDARQAAKAEPDAPVQAASKRAAPAKTGAPKTARERAAPAKAAPKKVAPAKAASTRAALGKTGAPKTAPQRAASAKVAPAKAASKKVAPAKTEP